MKKVINITVAIVAPFALKAQADTSDLQSERIFNAVASIFVVALFMIFILAIIKRLLDNRLKNKILDKGVPENIVSSILKTNPKEDRNLHVKWFAILTALGIGLTIINYTLPLGFHSLAIMSFSLAAGFLGYYLFARYSEK
jgi:drug/metabolite transporter (DMT)-like permease